MVIILLSLIHQYIIVIYGGYYFIITYLSIYFINIFYQRVGLF